MLYRSFGFQIRATLPVNRRVASSKASRSLNTRSLSANQAHLSCARPLVIGMRTQSRPKVEIKATIELGESEKVVASTLYAQSGCGLLSSRRRRAAETDECNGRCKNTNQFPYPPIVCLECCTRTALFLDIRDFRSICNFVLSGFRQKGKILPLFVYFCHSSELKRNV